LDEEEDVNWMQVVGMVRMEAARSPAGSAALATTVTEIAVVAVVADSVHCQVEWNH